MTSSNENRRVFVSSLAAAVAWLSSQAALLADDLLSLRKGRRRITPVCSLPPADYQYGARSPSLIVRSLPVLPQYSVSQVEDAIQISREVRQSLQNVRTRLSQVDTATPEGIFAQEEAILDRRLAADRLVHRAQLPISKLIQLPNSELVIAHCRITDVGLRIEPSGNWFLSLRGEQNYPLAERESNRNVALQLKRNAFHVSARLLQTNRSGGENSAPSNLTAPAVAQGGAIVLGTIDLPKFWVQREAPELITLSGYHTTIATHFHDIDQVEFEFFIALDSLTGSGEGVVATW